MTVGVFRVPAMYVTTAACMFFTNLHAQTLIRRIELMPGSTHVRLTAATFTGVRVPQESVCVCERSGIVCV